jgi:hypothetical protein
MGVWPVAELAELFGTLSADRHLRGRQFERLCHWFFSNNPIYSQQVKRLWLWRDWPERWGPDAGIDLDAKTHAGDLWAIQAKAYDERYAIKKSDVDTFLSESARPGFTFRLIIATTNEVGRTAKRTRFSFGQVGRCAASGVQTRKLVQRADKAPRGDPWVEVEPEGGCMGADVRRPMCLRLPRATCFRPEGACRRRSTPRTMGQQPVTALQAGRAQLRPNPTVGGATRLAMES